MSGPPSSSITLPNHVLRGRLRNGGSSCKLRMISPPRIQRLSRCVRKVLRESSRVSRCSRNGLKHSTRRCPGAMSRGSTDQLRGQLSRSGQYCAKRSVSDATIALLSMTFAERPLTKAGTLTDEQRNQAVERGVAASRRRSTASLRPSSAIAIDSGRVRAGRAVLHGRVVRDERRRQVRPVVRADLLVHRCRACSG